MAGLLDDALDGGAAYGFFPQLKAKRNLQDTQASADIPLQVLRGRLAGLLGLPGDIGNVVRSPMPTEMFGDYNYEQPTQLTNTTEKYLNSLPLAPTSRVGQIAGQAGSYVPLNPLPALRTAKDIGEFAVRGGGEMLNAAMMGENQGLLGKIVPQPMFAMAPGKAIAPVSELGFYSAVEKQALNIPRNQGSGESFLNDLLKGQDVKKYEIEAMGLADYLKGKTNVNKKEVQDFIANNKIDVQERVLSGTGKKSRVFSEFNPAIDKFVVYGDGSSIQGAFNTAQEAEKFVNNYNAQIPYGPSTYDSYQLPGGENYREILLTLPFKEPPMPRGYGVSSVQYEDGTRKYFAETPTSRSQGFKTQEEAQSELAKTAANLKGFRQNLESYKSSHFNEPNILAHMRVNDRIDADGKKMLLIEEVQSDWHQAGRKGGYAGENQKALLKNQTRLGEIDKILATAKYTPEEGSKLLNEQGKLVKEYAELESKRARGGDVPDAPFKDTWHELALKKAIKEAVDKGYDRVGLTTGAQQAERYDLSKQVDDLNVFRNQDGTFSIKATLMTDQSVQDVGKQIQPEKLSDYVGNDLAKQMLQQKSGTKKYYSGNDLKVGGEGMKKYYDEIYPGFLNKFGKKYGSQVGETSLGGSSLSKAEIENKLQFLPNGFKTSDGRFFDDYDDAIKHEFSFDKSPKVRYLDITPEMRKAVKEGLPLASNGQGLLDYFA